MRAHPACAPGAPRGARHPGSARSPRPTAARSGSRRSSSTSATPNRARRPCAQATEHLGSVDALIHFAGVWSGTGWEDSDPAEWARILAINLTGTFLIAQAVARHMVAAKAGAIVLTASDSAKVGGVAGGPAYVASKGGVIALTRSLARALGPHGVRVNAVNPGVVDTPMTTQLVGRAQAGDGGAHAPRAHCASRRHRRRRLLPGVRRGALHHRRGRGGEWRVLFRLAARM